MENSDIPSNPNSSSMNEENEANSDDKKDSKEQATKKVRIQSPQKDEQSVHNEEEVINPFIYETSKISFYEVLKIIIALFTFFIPRFILFLIALFGTYFWCKISIMCASKEALKGKVPLSFCRRGFQFIARLHIRLALFSLGYLWVCVKGKPAPRKEAPILVCNHMSMCDVMFLLYYSGGTFVGKHELSKMPIVGTVATCFQTIYVKRQSKDSRGDVIEAIKTRASLKKAPKVCIFPEGTTTNGRALICYKQGAFAPGLPVQPVVIRYPFWFFSPHWVPTAPSTGFLLFRMMCQFINFMQVEYLPVYKPNEAEIKDPILYADNVRTICANVLNIPITNHTFEDMLLMRQALEIKEPPKTLNFEISTIKKLYNMDLETSKEMLIKFSQLDEDHDGYVNLGEFGKLLNLPRDSIYTKNLFDLFDEDHDGVIDFREFLAGFSLLSKKAQAQESLEFTFKLFDRSGKGTITRSDFVRIFRRTFRGIADEDVQKSFDAMDTNGDGLVTYEEFLDFTKKNPQYTFLFENISSAIQMGMSLGNSALGTSTLRRKRTASRLFSSQSESEIKLALNEIDQGNEEQKEKKEQEELIEN